MARQTSQIRHTGKIWTLPSIEQGGQLLDDVLVRDLCGACSYVELHRNSLGLAGIRIVKRPDRSGELQFDFAGPPAHRTNDDLDVVT